MGEANSNSDKALRYEVYLEERKLLIDAEREGARSLDKAILTLAAGALGLSLTFIRQMVPDIKHGTFAYLITAWGLFSLSILLTLISFLTSQWACARQREILETEYLNDKNCKKESVALKNKPSTWTKILNIFAIISFMVGVIFLAGFSIINLREDAMPEKKIDKDQRGFVPPKLPVPQKPGKKAGFVPPELPKEPPAPKPKDPKK
jgi:hypothetical protein